MAGILVTAATAIVLYAPQLATIASQWNYFQRRTRAVYILGGDNQGKPMSEKPGIVVESATRKAYQLFSREIPLTADRDNRYLRTDKGALTLPTAVLLGLGMLISVFWYSETLSWWVFLIVTFSMTETLTTGSLNGARGIIFVPVLYLFIGLVVHLAWRLCSRLYRPLVVVVVAGVFALSVSTARQYFEWVRSEPLLSALEPAIPVSEFFAWQAFVLHWTATQRGSFNVYMWKERQGKLHERPGA